MVWVRAVGTGWVRDMCWCGGVRWGNESTPLDLDQTPHGITPRPIPTHT